MVVGGGGGGVLVIALWLVCFQTCRSDVEYLS